MPQRQKTWSRRKELAMSLRQRSSWAGFLCRRRRDRDRRKLRLTKCAGMRLPPVAQCQCRRVTAYGCSAMTALRSLAPAAASCAFDPVHTIVFSRRWRQECNTMHQGVGLHAVVARASNRRWMSNRAFVDDLAAKGARRRATPGAFLQMIATILTSVLEPPHLILSVGAGSHPRPLALLAVPRSRGAKTASGSVARTRSSDHDGLGRPLGPSMPGPVTRHKLPPYAKELRPRRARST